MIKYNHQQVYGKKIKINKRGQGIENQKQKNDKNKRCNYRVPADMEHGILL